MFHVGDEVELVSWGKYNGRIGKVIEIRYDGREERIKVRSPDILALWIEGPIESFRNLSTQREPDWRV